LAVAVRVEVAWPFAVRLTLAGLREAESPFFTIGLTVADSVIVPVKPLRLCRVIVDVLKDSPLRVREMGLAEMLKVGGGGGGLALKPAASTVSGSIVLVNTTSTQVVVPWTLLGSHPGVPGGAVGNPIVALALPLTML
jgi:hypothetical protein